MNAYLLNGMAGHFFRQAVCEALKIPHTEIYKTVKKITTRVTNDTVWKKKLN